MSSAACTGPVQATHNTGGGVNCFLNNHLSPTPLTQHVRGRHFPKQILHYDCEIHKYVGIGIIETNY